MISLKVICLEDSEGVRRRMENDLLVEYNEFIIQKQREEGQIILKAETALSVLEKELLHLFEDKYYSSE